MSTTRPVMQLDVSRGMALIPGRGAGIRAEEAMLEALRETLDI
jgi:hypothetical protein